MANANDSFAGAVNTLLQDHVSDSGHAWVAMPGSTGNAILNGDGSCRDQYGNLPRYYLNVTPLSADYDVTVTTTAPTTQACTGPMGRTDTVANTAYFIWWSNSGLNWRLYKVIAGVFTIMGTYAGDSPIAASRTAKLEMRGTAIKAFIDGVERISVTDSSITAAGHPGLAFGGYPTGAATTWSSVDYDVTMRAAVSAAATSAAGLATSIQLNAAVSVSATQTGGLETGAAVMDAAVTATATAASVLTAEIRLAGALTPEAAVTASWPNTWTTYYLSPSGNDANNGLSTGAPKQTFANAFAAMAAGDELVLLDGSYSDALGTGYINHNSTFGAQPKSGVSRARPTIVRAQNPGFVTITGGSGGTTAALFLGRNNSTGKVSFINIDGIKFINAGSLYNTSYCKVTRCGFRGGFGIGTNDHLYGNTYNLVEDIWIWGAGLRIIAINYRAHNNVWRRVIVRGEGCGTAGCTGSGNPNVGFTAYESQDNSFQNVLVIDRLLAPTDSGYASFASAQHTNDASLFLTRNEWLGCAAIESPDGGFTFEADFVTDGDPVWTVRNCLAYGSAGIGFNLNTMPVRPNVMDGFTAIANTSSGIRIAPGQTQVTARDIVSVGNGSIGVTSASVPSYVDAAGNAGGNYSQTTCAVGCLSTDPMGTTPVGMLYPVKIESGSSIKGTGYLGADYGANIVNRIGLDGTISGDADFNTDSGVALWPWPLESRIKTDMAPDGAHGFCSPDPGLYGGPTTLTTYVWELLGTAFPVSDPEIIAAVQTTVTAAAALTTFPAAQLATAVVADATSSANLTGAPQLASEVSISTTAAADLHTDTSMGAVILGDVVLFGNLTTAVPEQLQAAGVVTVLSSALLTDRIHLGASVTVRSVASLYEPPPPERLVGTWGRGWRGGHRSRWGGFGVWRR